MNEKKSNMKSRMMTIISFLLYNFINSAVCTVSEHLSFNDLFFIFFFYIPRYAVSQ